MQERIRLVTAFAAGAIAAAAITAGSTASAGSTQVTVWLLNSSLRNGKTILTLCSAGFVSEEKINIACHD